MRPVQSCSVSVAGNIETVMREIRSARFDFIRRALEMVLDLAQMSLGLIRELFRQKRILQGRHAVPRP